MQKTQDLKLFIFYLIIGVLLLKPQDLNAQQWEFGANLGGTGYMGDINPHNVLYYKHAGGGVHTKYNLNGTWGVRFGANFLKLKGADADAKNQFQRTRNLSFDNNVMEVSLLADFNFFEYLPGMTKSRFTPYLFAGVGMIHHRPTVRYGQRDYRGGDLMVDQTYYRDENGAVSQEQHRPFAVTVPFGFGVKYNFNGPWSIGAEANYRTAFTNKIDNVSGIYTNLAYQELPSSIRSEIDETAWQFLADPSGQSGSNAGRARGTSYKYDGYMTIGVTITYSIASTRCYWW